MNEQAISSASTSMTIQASKAAIWTKVGFYEHVQKEPSWLLKLSLPVPREVEGHHSKVGDTCRCKYSDGGFLTKRMTRIVDESRIEFEIIEQSIRYSSTIKLLGGSIEVEEVDEGQCIVRMVTYYQNLFSLKTISAVFIDKVIKTMHQFVIADMRLQLEGCASPSKNYISAYVNDANITT
ncbi:hypothetical protein HSX11_27895 [Oxalobacteraceae bacterium]|nr:hypothetical protein [Oxalobacteraceae bacterium]